jgi:Fe-S-cluster-containing dehydrogenase component
MDKWNLIINIGLCENCHNCVIADRDEHVGNDYPGYAAAAAPAGEAPIRILRRVQGQAPMVETTYLPVLCNHCDDPPCMRVGGDAISKRTDGIVIIDPAKAKGRQDIARACPYEAIVWNEEAQVPETWIFDAHLLDAGWERPRCQQSCPTGVFEAVKLDDKAMQEKVRKEGLRTLLPKLNAKPRVYYRGLDRWEKCFIGGSVSATVSGVVDCVADAVISLFQGEKRIATTKSDDFGDFRFVGLTEGSGPYRIEIDHSLGQARRDCLLDESVYLGEIRIA